jgi:diguanylate cyclase (GGDEF)-like protein
VAEILRTPVAECAPLAEELVDRTGGNPYETVEFVNALRRDGALALGPDGWTWDTDAVHRHLGSGNLIHLLTKRLRALPSRTLRMLQTLSCLGAEVEMSTLALIGDDTVGEVAERIRPALEEGLVVSVDAGDSGTVGAISTIVFRHDRVQQAAHDSLTEDERRDLMLSLARTLARHGRGPDAAQLYLEVVDQIGEPGELRRVVGLFQAAAEATRRAFNPRLVRRYVEAAADLHRRAGGRTADPTGVALDIALHAALYDLGRMTETDAVFDRIRSAVPDPVELVPVVGLQMSGLTGRALHRECVELGLEQLGQLGWPAPDGPGSLDQAVRRSYDEIERWFEAGGAEQDAGRDEPADPRTRAAAALVARLCPATFAVDQRLMSWLVTIGWRLWVGAGPLPDLVTCLSHSNSWSQGLRENGRLDHRLIQHALLVGRSRHYETDTAAAYFAYSSVLAAHFDPIDEIIAETRKAREILLRRGRQQLACYCYVAMVPELLDTAASLDVAETEARAGLMLANRLENYGTRFSMLINLRLIDRLRGGGPAATDELAGLPGRASPVVGYRFHADALAGALLDDGPGLATAAAALEPLRPLMAGMYCHALSDLLLGLDAARQARTPGADRTALLGRLDTYRQRLAQNAAQAPDNYRHLSALLDAERARLTSDPLSTLRAYEQALDAVAEAGRPWHRALTYEHAAQAHLDLGLRRSGLTLLGQARTAYLNWGATAKVQALDAAHPQLRGTAAPDQGQGRSSNTGLTANSLDMLAILQASQAISSQTDPGGLRTVLVEQLRTLTGAVDVQVLLPADNGGWLLQPDDPGAPGIPVETAGASNLIPLSVFRYVERIREPLIVADARQDDRFGADGFFASFDHCSLFTVPIVQGGVLRAVLIMTNPRSRGAFTADGRSAVELIAGQLAVSLDNTQLYQSLEAKVLARTHDLESARHQLETLSLTDALTLIGNRRRFDIALQDEWAAHLAAPLTVIMMDIDHFKGYNDLGGHLAGDSCLQSVAAALSAAVRTGDLICRYGGEEFAAILPQTPAEAAFGIAERLRTNVSDLGLPHPAGGIVTVSIGTATSVSRDESGPQAVVAAADRAEIRTG